MAVARSFGMLLSIQRNKGCHKTKTLTDLYGWISETSLNSGYAVTPQNSCSNISAFYLTSLTQLARVICFSHWSTCLYQKYSWQQNIGFQQKTLGIPRCRREDNIKIDKIVYCNQLDTLIIRLVKTQSNAFRYISTYNHQDLVNSNYEIHHGC